MNDNVGMKKIANNFNEVRVGKLRLYFSYETIVAFQDATDLVVCENVWSSTTGKHLNMLDPGKKYRVSLDDFYARLNEATSKF